MNTGRVKGWPLPNLPTLPGRPPPPFGRREQPGRRGSSNLNHREMPLGRLPQARRECFAGIEQGMALRVPFVLLMGQYTVDEPRLGPTVYACRRNER